MRIDRAYDGCGDLGEEGWEEDEDDPLIDFAETPPGGEDEDEGPTRLIRRQSGPSSSDSLLYDPLSIAGVLVGSNLVATEKSVKHVYYDHDKSSEDIYQINELRCLGYDWRIVGSYDNKEGSEDLTETVDMETGLESTSGSDTKAEISVNMGYKGFGAHLNIAAGLSKTFFNSQKQAVKKTEKVRFFVAKGKALYLYQKVIKWESKVKYRLVSKGPPLVFEGRSARGSWTLGWTREDPVEQVMEFEVATNEKVAKDHELFGIGTFTVSRSYRTKPPLFPSAPVFPSDGWSKAVKGYFRERNIVEGQ